jgi:hypothetical protein
MQKLLNWARQLPLRPLLVISAVALWVLDILSAFYFARYWEASGLPYKLLQVALLSRKLEWDDLDPNSQEQIIALLTSTGGIMLLTFLIVNSVFYFYLVWKKRWSWQYVLTYATTAAGFSFITALEGVPVGTTLVITNALSIPAYLILAGVLWARKADCSEKGFRLRPSQNPE